MTPKEYELKKKLGFRVVRTELARTPVQIETEGGATPGDQWHLLLWNQLLAAEGDPFSADARQAARKVAEHQIGDGSWADMLMEVMQHPSSRQTAELAGELSGDSEDDGPERVG